MAEKPQWCGYIQGYCYIPDYVETEHGKVEKCCLTSRMCCLTCPEPCEPFKHYIELTLKHLKK